MTKESTEEKALAVPDETTKALGDLIDWGAVELPEDGTEGVKPRFPELKIVQGTSKMEGSGKHGGDFWLSENADGEPEYLVGNPEVVFLQSQQTRALFGDAPAPLCASSNGINPLPGQPLWRLASFKTINGEEVPVEQEEPFKCADCVFSQFRDGAAPLCSRSYLTLIDLNADPEDMDLVQFRVSRTGLKPFEQFAGALKAVKLSKTRIGAPSYAFVATLRTDETNKDGKKWYQLAIDKRRLEDTAILAYAQAVKGIRGEWQESVKETVLRADDEAVAGEATDQWGDGSQSYAAPKDVTPGGWEEGE